MISLATILTNNNLFIIVSIQLTGNMWDTHSEKCFKTHGDHEYDISLVLFLPYKIPLKLSEFIPSDDFKTRFYKDGRDP